VLLLPAQQAVSVLVMNYVTQLFLWLV